MFPFSTRIEKKGKRRKKQIQGSLWQFRKFCNRQKYRLAAEKLKNWKIIRSSTGVIEKFLELWTILMETAKVLSELGYPTPRQKCIVG